MKKHGIRIIALMTALFALVAGSFIISPTPKASAATGKNNTAEVNEMLDLLNEFRQDKGLSKVKVDIQISQVSVDWSAKMADTGDFKHNPNYASDSRIPAGKRAWGEIVAWNSMGDVEFLFNQWVKSAPHNAIMSNGAYNTVGIGLAYNSKGAIYGTINFYKYDKALSTSYSTYPGKTVNGYVLKGNIGNYYTKNSAKTGKPLMNERKLSNPSGVYQKFEKGTVYWSSGNGTHLVKGGIKNGYKRAGYEKGSLGFPIGDEVQFKYAKGKYYQKFENGMITWSSSTQGHELKGGILSKWKSLGWERSKLGLPTSAEYKSGGKTRQNFENGYITWTSKERAKVYYN